MQLNDNTAVALVLRAHEARDREAEHYNGFKVGAAGYYIAPNGSVKFITGANTKRTPEEKKDCAEMKVLREARRLGVTLNCLLIVGLPRREDTELTLHPCEECRKLMRKFLRSGKVLRTITPIHLIHPSLPVQDVLTVRELMWKHDEPLWGWNED